MTAAELLLLPHDARYELWRGHVRRKPFMGGQEGMLTARLSCCVGEYAHKSAPGGAGFSAGTGFWLERMPDTVLCPRLAFICPQRVPRPMPPGFLTLAPDLVLETRSPFDRPKAVADKVKQWLSLGVRLVWEMNPATQIVTFYQPSAEPVAVAADGTLDGGDVLPGWTLLLFRVFG